MGDYYFDMEIRLIEPEDNHAVAKVIRTVMTEHGAVGEGYSINDPEVDQMYESYHNPESAFFVVIDEQGQVAGCGGIGPLSDAGSAYCELKKMYFYPHIRGKGLGRQLVQKCIETARSKNYQYCYIESLESMEKAVRLYKYFGFTHLKAPIGNTGHSSCNVQMLLEL